MRAESCRKWRESLGAYALGDLPAGERAALEAHLDGCPGCRAEASSLRDVVRLLGLVDPARIAQPAPQPPAALGERIATAIGGERRSSRRRRQRRRAGLALGAAAAVVLAILLLPGGDGGSGPEQHVEFASLPPGISIGASLAPHSFGTEIRVYVHGVRSGTLCEVFLRGPHGVTMPAGTFRYRWGEDSTATLSSALDLSRTRAIGVRAGNRTFIAPVDPDGATATDTDEEDAT